MKSSHRHRTDRSGRLDPLLQRYMPPHFGGRLPREGRAWRGRAVLLLWGLGYPFEMAWSLGLSGEADDATELRTSIERLDDARLIELLDATADRRGDASHLMWLAFG